MTSFWSLSHAHPAHTRARSHTHTPHKSASHQKFAALKCQTDKHKDGDVSAPRSRCLCPHCGDWPVRANSLRQIVFLVAPALQWTRLFCLRIAVSQLRPYRQRQVTRRMVDLPAGAPAACEDSGSGSTCLRVPLSEQSFLHLRRSGYSTWDRLVHGTQIGRRRRSAEGGRGAVCGWSIDRKSVV